MAGLTRRRVVRGHRSGTDPSEHHPAAHCLRELRLSGGPGGLRLGANQQVRRGLPGQALLRRQRARRRGRGPGSREGQGFVRRGSRQRATPCRCQRQHGRLSSGAGTRRHGAGHETRPGWSPHPRLASQLQRAPLRLRVLRRDAQRRADRHGRSSRPGAGPPPEADRCGGHGLPPDHRTGSASGDRRGGRSPAHVRRRPHRRAHRGRRPPQPGALLRHRHLHHPQDPARSPGRLHPLDRRVRDRYRQGGLPWSPGRTAGTPHRREGGGLPGGRRPVVRRLRTPDRGQRPGPGRGPIRPWLPARLGWHRQPPTAGRPEDLR